MSLLKVVIVEDEPESRKMIKKMVEMFCPEVTIAGVADSVKTAVELINDVRPDIVLLDIELHPGNCFDIFPQLDKLDLEVIFTTAYKDYAIDAIKRGALDYLLKPIDIEELKLAIDKAVEKRSAKEENVLLKKFLLEFKSSSGSSRISLHTTYGIVYAEVGQITRCESKGPYTNIYFKDGTKYMTSKNLKEYELSLKDLNFFRLHNSHLINLTEVKQYIKADGGSVEMKDGSQIPISQNRKEQFFELMKTLM